MQRIQIDRAAPAVKKFLRSLPLTPNGVQLELAGQVIGQFLPPSEFSAVEKAAVIARGRELVKRARQRNKGVPARVLEREVHEAVKEVRQRRQQ